MKGPGNFEIKDKNTSKRASVWESKLGENYKVELTVIATLIESVENESQPMGVALA